MFVWTVLTEVKSLWQSLPISFTGLKMDLPLRRIKNNFFFKQEKKKKFPLTVETM